jgi:hypothetical protein
LAFVGITADSMSVGCNTVVVVAFEEPALFVSYFLLSALLSGRMLRNFFELPDEKSFG